MLRVIEVHYTWSRFLRSLKKSALQFNEIPHRRGQPKKFLYICTFLRAKKTFKIFIGTHLFGDVLLWFRRGSVIVIVPRHVVCHFYCLELHV